MAGHRAKVPAELQAQYEHLRHLQHVANEVLNDTRQQLAGTTDLSSVTIGTDDTAWSIRN
jgi:hypothetical protein